MSRREHRLDELRNHRFDEPLEKPEKEGRNRRQTDDGLKYVKMTKRFLETAKRRIANPAEYARRGAGPSEEDWQIDSFTEAGEAVRGEDEQAATRSIAGALSWTLLRGGEGNQETYNDARSEIAKAIDQLRDEVSEDARKSEHDIDINAIIETARAVSGDFKDIESVLALIRKASGVCSHETAMKVFDQAIEHVEWRIEINGPGPYRANPYRPRRRRTRSPTRQLRDLANHMRGVTEPAPPGESLRETLEAVYTMLERRDRLLKWWTLAKTATKIFKAATKIIQWIEKRRGKKAGRYLYSIVRLLLMLIGNECGPGPDTDSVNEPRPAITAEAETKARDLPRCDEDEPAEEHRGYSVTGRRDRFSPVEL